MPPTASLPWYDFPSTEKYLDSVYRQIRQPLMDSSCHGLPEQLDRLTPLAEQWSDKSLFLSQCCGSDLQSPAGCQLDVIARPLFNSLDGPAGYYFSHIVSRSKNLATPNIVVNATTSFSGCTALLSWLEGNRQRLQTVSNQWLAPGQH